MLACRGGLVTPAVVPPKATPILEWLKEDYGLGRGHGKALVHVITSLLPPFTLPTEVFIRLNILSGLDTPTAGSAQVAGHDLLGMSARRRLRYRRHTVGFVWQQTSRNLLPYLTSAENVAVPAAVARQVYGADITRFLRFGPTLHEQQAFECEVDAHGRVPCSAQCVGYAVRAARSAERESATASSRANARQELSA
jgi:hypothetical protein